MRKQRETDNTVSCKCGCGQTFKEYNRWGDKVEYVFGHRNKGNFKYDRTLTVLCACGCGQTRTRYDKRGREKRFIHNHSPMKGKKSHNYKPELHTSERIFCACGCGETRLKFYRGKECRYIMGHRNRFKKGQKMPWRKCFEKGHKWGEEVEARRRRSLSVNRKGMVFSESHRANISKGKSGLKNPKLSAYLRSTKGETAHHWKGGLTPINHLLRSNLDVVIWRNSVFQRDNYTCKNPNCPYCNNRRGGVVLNCHHIRRFSKYPAYRLEIQNGITLCEGFHYTIKNHEDNYIEYFNKILGVA